MKSFLQSPAVTGPQKLRRPVKPIGVSSLFRRTNSLFGHKSSLFPEEQGMGCKLLNSFDDRLPKPLQEAGIGRNFQTSLLISLLSGNAGLGAGPVSADGHSRCLLDRPGKPA